jgi:hypothetical protein
MAELSPGFAEGPKQRFRTTNATISPISPQSGL